MDSQRRRTWWYTLKGVVGTRRRALTIPAAHVQRVQMHRAADQRSTAGDIARLLNAIKASRDRIFQVGLVFKRGLANSRKEKPGWMPRDAVVSSEPMPQLVELHSRTASGALLVIEHGQATAEIENLQAFRTLCFPGIEGPKPHWLTVRLDYKLLSGQSGSGHQVQLTFDKLNVL